ncbi:hypothetical protein NECAME_02062 [Necator americanus]|uniref:Uncharacterized protein n=1 Tax=Necator americanus TaxID=51031 RepID=W2TL88_NECAM|nr:hypothetical protein NECAME_02062 [Necator americanus]ETN81772.1 hypothetical protein NECAME_02062 [Necator americanus]
MLRLKLQGGDTLSSTQVHELIKSLSVCDFIHDNVRRRSLLLVLETVCRHVWQFSEFAKSRVRRDCHDFASAVLQKICRGARDIHFADIEAQK